MPYIIASDRPITSDAPGMPYHSRRAVATLGDNRPDYHTPGRVTAQGEAWRIAWESYGGTTAPDSAERRRDLNAALTLPEPGGTIGPLPDGTVIEVAQTTWIDFGRMVRERWGYQGGGQKDIDAYNAHGQED